MKNLILLLLITSNIYGQSPCGGSLPLPPNSHRQLETPRVIFLDFDGSNVDPNVWPISYASPSGLNQKQIDSVIRLVKEDFAPFQVDITTDSTIPNSQQLIITNTDFNGNSGGVSYLHSWGFGKPNFAFVNHLLNRARFIGEACSHELGHSLGLNHQSRWSDTCTIIEVYNSGHDLVAPIMGVSYYKPYSRWWLGTPQWSCTTLQDDLNTISQTLPFKPAANTNLSSSIHLIGVVTPVPELYSLVITNSLLHLDITLPQYTDLIPIISLLNGQKKFISHNVDTVLTAGQWYVQIEGDTYGSLGQYTLTGQASTVLTIRDDNSNHPDFRVNKKFRMESNLLFYYAAERNLWKVFDVLGRVVLSGTASKGSNLIDLQKLSEGVYIFKCEQTTRKFFK